MGFVLDMMIAFSALSAAAYCLLLSRRLRAFTRLDGDVGKAIAVLSQQVDALTNALRAAEQSNARADSALEQQISRAEMTARKLELLMAAQHIPSSKDIETQSAAEKNKSNEEFAPFGRSTIHTAEERSRVLRKRDTVRVAR